MYVIILERTPLYEWEWCVCSGSDSMVYVKTGVKVWEYQQNFME